MKIIEDADHDIFETESQYLDLIAKSVLSSDYPKTVNILLGLFTAVNSLKIAIFELSKIMYQDFCRLELDNYQFLSALRDLLNKIKSYFAKDFIMALEEKETTEEFSNFMQKNQDIWSEFIELKQKITNLLPNNYNLSPSCDGICCSLTGSYLCSNNLVLAQF